MFLLLGCDTNSATADNPAAGTSPSSSRSDSAVVQQWTKLAPAKKENVIKVSVMLPSFEKICMGNSSVASIANSALRYGWEASSYLDASYFLWFKEQLSVKGQLLDFRTFEKAGLSLLLYRHQIRPNEKSGYKSVTVIGCDMIDMSGATEIDDPTLEAAFGPLDDSKRTPALDSSGLVTRFWLKWVKDPSKRIIYIRDEKRGQSDLTSDPHQMAGKAMLRSSWDEQK